MELEVLMRRFFITLRHYLKKGEKERKPYLAGKIKVEYIQRGKGFSRMTTSQFDELLKGNTISIDRMRNIKQTFVKLTGKCHCGKDACYSDTDGGPYCHEHMPR